MKTKLFLLLLASGAIFLASCLKYPPTSDRLLEDLAIVTQYDTKTDFNNYKTYSISNTVMKITSKDTVQINNAATQAVLSEIDKNMKARGFVPAATGTKPDLGIQVTYFENTYVYTYYYDWWGYYPYWGYYYPYYPVYYSSYTAGAAYIDLIDLKYPNASDNSLALRWTAFIRGLLTGTHTTADLTGAVDQAFTQTPQIQTSASITAK